MPVKWVHRVNTFINISLPFTDLTLFTGFDSPRHLPVVRKRERNSLSFSVGIVFQDVNMYYLDTSCVEFPSYHHCLVIAESEWTNHCRWILFENPELHAAVKPAVIPFVGYKNYTPRLLLFSSPILLHTASPGKRRIWWKSEATSERFGGFAQKRKAFGRPERKVRFSILSKCTGNQRSSRDLVFIELLNAQNKTNVKS